MAKVSTQEATIVAPTIPLRQRAFGIDAGRICMAFLVVTLHSLPVKGAQFAIVGVACRCAVPFFLIATGYFLKVPQRFSPTLITRPLMRLMPIYVFWMIVYYTFACSTGVSPLLLGVRYLLSGGTAFHLWYLPAAGVAMVLVPAGILLIGVRATGVVCAVLAAAVVALGTYHDVLHLPGGAQRGGLLVAPFFVFIGYLLARRSSLPALPTATALALLGFAFALGEEWLISRHLRVPLADHDFAIGTFVYGTGAFLVAQALAPGAGARRLATLGQFALGVYVSHILFVWIGGVLFGKMTITALLWRVPLTFGCALLLTAALRRVPYLRSVVA